MVNCAIFHPFLERSWDFHPYMVSIYHHFLVMERQHFLIKQRPGGNNEYMSEVLPIIPTQELLLSYYEECMMNLDQLIKAQTTPVAPEPVNLKRKRVSAPESKKKNKIS